MRGAVELLVARAALKREMRAEMTMIVSRENNPLKFSADSGSRAAAPAGRPRAGVHGAGAGGTRRLRRSACAPAGRDGRACARRWKACSAASTRQQLEGKLTRKSAIGSLIPATRKARLWELFQELFSQLQSEAQDDFDELFGKAFLKAYEDQLDRLQGEPGPR